MTKRIVGVMLVILGLALSGAAFITRAIGPVGGVQFPRWPFWAGVATAAIGLAIAIYRPNEPGG
jgi:hypothetical protein